jgi:ribosomal protein S18 acetylase RimI-like enzyme
MRLNGIVGVYRSPAAKTKHKAVIWGMYVRACARRSGLGYALLRKAIEHATLSVEEIILTVGANNNAALMLYEAAGFQKYGIERRALKIDERYYDEALMSLTITSR